MAIKTLRVKIKPGVTCKLIWTGGCMPEPSHEVYRCAPCSQEYGDIDSSSDEMIAPARPVAPAEANH